MLANADRLMRLSTEAYAALYEGEASALSALAGVWKRVVGTGVARCAVRALRRRARRPSRPASKIWRFSFARTCRISRRLPIACRPWKIGSPRIERLKRKFGPTLADVLARQQDLQRRIVRARRQRGAGGRARSRRACRARAVSWRGAAGLTSARQRAACRSARALEQALGELAMPKSRVDIRVAPARRPSRLVGRTAPTASSSSSRRIPARTCVHWRGSRRAANCRASCSHSARSSRDEARGRTLIFDEVDAGIGGAAADAVGARLQALARRDQVLCITHLPQIAARAARALHISKQVKGRSHVNRRSPSWTTTAASGRWRA